MKQMRGAAARNGRGMEAKNSNLYMMTILWTAFVLSVALVLTVAALYGIAAAAAAAAAATSLLLLLF